MGGIRRGGDTDGLHSQRPNHRFAGVGPLMKQGGEAGILSDPLFGGNRLCSPKRAGRDQKKMLIDGVYGDVIARHTSPGIVGRLMGLDIMPSFGVHSQNTCNGNHSQDMSPESCRDESWSCHDKYAFAGDVSRRTSTDEIPEFKDVFEVMETTRVKNQNHDTSSRHDKVNSADLNFARQKFMDAKRLSTDESFQRSKEFNDALDALVSNKELLMEILQESNNVAASDPCDLNCSPSSGLNRITLLKPSRRNKFIDADVVYPPEEDTGRCFHTPKEAKHSPRKPSISFPSQPLKEGTSSFRQKLSRSSYKERVDKRISPTRIVVLKPCIEKNQNMEGAFPLTHDMFCSSYRRTNTCLDDGIRRPYAEESMPQISTGYSDVRCHTGKGYREIAQEVSTQMKTAAKGGAGGKQKLNPNIGVSNWGDEVPLLSSNGLKSSAASQRSSGLCEGPSAPRLGASPTYSTKTSIRKEARRRLSDRWKATHQYQQPSQDANTFSTLGDMLALSDKEASKLTSGATACQQSPNGELHRTVMPGSCGYSLGSSSNDGWKDENVCNLTRLESMFTSSIDRGSPKLSSRKASCMYGEYSMVENIISAGPYSEDLHHDRPRRSFVRSSTNPSLDEVESAVTEHEIHVNFEEPTYAVAAVPELSETGGRLVPARNSNCRLGAERYLDNGSAVPDWQLEAQSSAQNKMMGQEKTCTLDDHLFANSPRDPASQADESGHDRYEDHQAPSYHLTELLSTGSSSEDDQPSPVSVLESSLDADDCCSGGFEKISADLQELRMQLRLLKMEATDNADETELALSSGDETAASCKLVDESGLPSCAFWDEDGRDFSYVDDMLACLGIQSAEQVLLLNARYLSGSPACSDVYDHLEKKYSELILWPQSERRLLFDLTNAILVDMITCCGGKGLVKKRELSMKWDKEGLVEEVWGRVCGQRRETECFQEERLMGVGWLDCEDVTDEIAGDIGSMVGEDLLEEAIADLILLKVFDLEKDVISERQII